MESTPESQRALTWEQMHRIYSTYHKKLMWETSQSMIYRLSHPSIHDRHFVLKQLHPKLTKDAEFIREFIDEARFLQRFRSEPSVPQIYGFFCQDGGLFILQEYVEGRNLAEFLRARQQPLGEELSCWIGIGICDGLSAVHEKSLVFVDLCPSNIIIASQKGPRVTLIDLGSAIDTSVVSRPLVRVKATLPYMSPEHLRGSEAVNEQSDVFCLGVILFELLTGIIPLDHESNPDPGRISDAMHEHLAHSLTSSKLREILDKMLQVDSRQRYQSITCARTDLKYLLNEYGTSEDVVRKDCLQILQCMNVRD